MSMFFFKLITLIIRTMARPMISWVTYYNKLKLEQNKSRFASIIRNRLIWLGQTTNYYNLLINRKFFKISTNSSVADLTDEKALEKGAETISELIVYSILIILPIAEWIRQSRISKQKEAAKEDYIKSIKGELDEVIEENKKILEEIAEIGIIFSDINKRLEHKLI